MFLSSRACFLVAEPLFSSGRASVSMGKSRLADGLQMFGLLVS